MPIPMQIKYNEESRHKKEIYLNVKYPTPSPCKRMQMQIPL